MRLVMCCFTEYYVLKNSAVDICSNQDIAMAHLKCNKLFASLYFGQKGIYLLINRKNCQENTIKQVLLSWSEAIINRIFANKTRNANRRKKH